MSTGFDVPSAAMLTQIAADYGIDLTAAEADSYRSLMAGAINSYRRLEEFAEPKPDAKHRRDGGWQPKSEDNPCNGWYWRCNIEGAASGLLQGQRVAVKDVVSIAGIPMTIGSSLLAGFIPDFDATFSMPAAPSSARRIARPSRSRERDTPATTGRCAIRITRRITRADPRAAAPSSWPPARPTWRSAATRAARSGCPHRGRAYSG